MDEVRRTEFFHKGDPPRELMTGKRWLLLAHWMRLTTNKKQQFNAVLAPYRRVIIAYLLKKSPDRLWRYRCEGAVLRYLKSWFDQLH